MNCSSIDLKAYLLGEAGNGESWQVEQHLAGCAGCRQEIERLHVMQSALLSLREEEPPRRIAFVSDKVFEPRWYQRLWRSGPGVGFAAAAMLSAAILINATYRPPEVAAPSNHGVSSAQVQAMIQSEVAKRVDAAVQEAVMRVETAQRKKTAELVAAAEQRLMMEHRADLQAVQESFNYLRKRTNVLYTASADLGGRP
jgi:anti-sigma factor RsiW